MIHLSVMRNLFLCATRKRDCWKIVTFVLLLVQSLDDQGPSHLPGDRDQLPHPVLECPVCNHYQVGDNSDIHTSSILTTINHSAQTEIKFGLGPSAKQSWNPSFGSLPVYKDLSTRHDWPVKRAIINLPVRSKRNPTLPAIRWTRISSLLWDVTNQGYQWRRPNLVLHLRNKSHMKETVMLVGKFKLNSLDTA